MKPAERIDGLERMTDPRWLTKLDVTVGQPDYHGLLLVQQWKTIYT